MEDVLEDAVEVANWKPENMVKGIKTMAELDKDVGWPTPETRPDVQPSPHEAARRALDVWEHVEEVKQSPAAQSQLPDPPLYPATIVQQDLATLFQVRTPDEFCIDLRTLHAAMGVGRMFSGWITARIEELGFVVGTDYILIIPNGMIKECGVESKGRGGDRKTMTYLGTARTASHLGMAEKNERGREVRNFFFNVAQVAATTQVQHQLPQTYVESLRALLISKEAEEAAMKAKIAAEGHAKMMLQLASDAMDEMKVAREETRVVDEKLLVYPQSPTIKIIKVGTNTLPFEPGQP
jgi:phage anti-repressor protein